MHNTGHQGLLRQVLPSARAPRVAAARCCHATKVLVLLLLLFLIGRWQVRYEGVGEGEGRWESRIGPKVKVMATAGAGR